jgi:hypothetical protein
VKLLFCALLIVGALTTQALALSCNRSIPRAEPSKHCTASDIDHRRRGCSAADCDYGSNGCDVDWAPLCSGLELQLHKVFGWPRNTEPHGGDYVAE